METLPNLPKRKVDTSIRHNTYKLEDFVGKSDDFIKSSKTGTILVNYSVLINNFDLLKKILKLLKISQINCLDYESALFLEEHLDENIDLALVDDYQNKNRSYIDMTKFVRHNFFIPLSYFMWGIKFDDICNIRCLRYKEYDNMISINGDGFLCKHTLEKLKEIIESINSKDLSDLDKCILVSNYIQSKVQYVDEGFKSRADRVYIIEALEEEVTREKVGSVETVINENYGLCIAIANLTTLLLNNPIMNVNARSVYGDSHAWNIIKIGSSQYYVDNTWAITRNKDRVEEALKALSFSIDYMLFGISTANAVGHHNSLCYCDGNVEEDDYSKEILEKHIMTLSRKHSFTGYSQKLRFKSSVEKK